MGEGEETFTITSVGKSPYFLHNGSLGIDVQFLIELVDTEVVKHRGVFGNVFETFGL